MENQLITFGRYKNKTFEQVYNEDKDYCRLMLESRAAYRAGNTEEFRAFLKTKCIDHKKDDLFRSKLKFMFPKLDRIRSMDDLLQASKQNTMPPINKKIQSVKVTGLLKRFEDEHLIAFYIVKEPPITYQKLHEPSNLRLTNSYLGMFYGFVFRKYICKLTNEKAYDSRCRKVINIFPIRLNFEYDNYVGVSVPVLRYFNESIFRDVNDYLDRYYLKQDDVKREIFHLYRLIYEHGKWNELADLLNEDFLFFCEGKYLELLKLFMFFYCYCKQSGHHTVYKEDDEELDEEYTDCRGVVTSWFKYLLKYARSYIMYENYEGDIIDIIEDIYRMANLHHIYFHQRDEYLAEFRRNDIDDNSIRRIFQYIDSITHLDTCVIHPAINRKKFIYNADDNPADGCISFPEYGMKLDGCFLTADCDLFVNDTIIDITYSKFSKDDIVDFYKLIIYGTLITNKCTTLTIYNAYLGEETSINMIKNAEDVKKFIRHYACDKYMEMYVRSRGYLDEWFTV